MAILIDNQQNKRHLDLDKIRIWATVALDALDCPEGELSILFVDDDRMAAMNQEYLNRTGPTNVIAFPMREGPFGDVSPQLLGDVVISVDTTAREALNAGTSFDRRMGELLIHGILHLLGYDHETSSREARAMEAKTGQLMGLIRETG